MTKQELLEHVRCQFEQAIDENYEDFSISFSKSHGVHQMHVGGAYDGYKGFSHNYTVQLEPPQENDAAPLVDAAVHILTYPDPPLPALPPDARLEPGVPVIEDIVYS